MSIIKIIIEFSFFLNASISYFLNPPFFLNHSIVSREDLGDASILDPEDLGDTLASILAPEDLGDALASILAHYDLWDFLPSCKDLHV